MIALLMSSLGLSCFSMGPTSVVQAEQYAKWLFLVRQSNVKVQNISHFMNHFGREKGNENP